MLSWEYPPKIVGGISPHVHELSEELSNLGLEVHVVTQYVENALSYEVSAHGVHVHRVPLDKDSTNFFEKIKELNRSQVEKVRSLIEEWSDDNVPTILHAHDWLSLDSAKTLKHRYRLPLVATIHATEHGRNNGIHNHVQSTVHQQEYDLTLEAWRIIVCSYFMKEEIQSQFNTPRDKIDVIYNGIDKKSFRLALTSPEKQKIRRSYAKDHEKIVLYAGRFVPEKGIHLLLNAAGIVTAKYPETKFIIVGSGHRDHYESFVDWVGLRKNIQFTGYKNREELKKLYHVADTATFPSLYEPFGIVALEAMAAKVPVVASDAGGLKEIVEHNVTGTSFYKGDYQSLAWAILRTFDEKEVASSLSDNAYERLGVDFCWSNLASQTYKVYEVVWREYLLSDWKQSKFSVSKQTVDHPENKDMNPKEILKILSAETSSYNENSMDCNEQIIGKDRKNA